MHGCTEENTDFPLGTIIGRRLSNKSVHYISALSAARDVIVRVKMIRSEFSCEVVAA